MTEFTKQYAIRLPNGLLHAHSVGQWVINDGIIRYIEDEDSQPEPVVYDTLEEAEQQIERFQHAAAHMGITEWLGRIESRTCSPFTDSSSAASEEMISGLQQFLEEQ